MITVKLLGGARKIVGKDQVSLEMQSIRVSEILETLCSMSSNPDILNSSNMLIAVNGTELSILGGLNAQVKDGDVVSIVPVVHGGTVEL
ncbi:MAG: MoaD/ThiS family protein [Nitrososphaerales archaeon]